MFNSCMNLEYVKVGVFSLDNDVDATMNWVSEIQHDGLFIFPCGSRYDKHGFSEVPMNFKIVASPVIVFQNPDSTILSCDTIIVGQLLPTMVRRLARDLVQFSRSGTSLSNLSPSRMSTTSPLNMRTWGMPPRPIAYA